MKIIEEFEKWLILKYALKEKGYKPCQYQYGAENENGFHVWFWKCNRLNVEVVTHGCLSDNPLEGYLKLHPEIRNIKFALDNDFNAKFSNGSPAPNWRQQAAEKLADKYMQLGYTTSID